MPAQPPTVRPPWVLVLASVMLLTGGSSLVAGLLKLRDPSTIVLTIGTNDAADSDVQVQLNRQLAQVRAAVVSPHRGMIRTEAAFEIVLALFTLYATAAVLSRDRNGRALTLGVVALSIAYQLGTLPVYLSLTREFASRGAELMAQLMIQSAGGKATPDAAEIARRLRSAIVGGPVVAAVISIAGSLVLLAFFGGRRGRALYGLDRAPRPRPRN